MNNIIKDTMNVLLSSSKFIQIFAVLIGICTITITIAFFTDYVGWWKAFGVFLFFSNCSLLCEFVDDRRVCSQEERDLWTLKKQAD
jgi:hypothetical protein